MKRLLLATLIAAGAAHAEERVRAIEFSDGSASVEVSADPSAASQTLVHVDAPGLDRPVYALKGMIRYTGVTGDAFLQMDNHFAGRGTFFTKGLSESGPLAKLNGSSDWRPFMLPFYADQDSESPTPDGISLIVVLPESGSVEIRDVALFQYAAGEDPLASVQGLAARAALLIAAIGGGLIGVWAGIIGMLASRGKARGFVLGSATVVLIAGIASLIAGVAAFATGQPYAVFYPLLLIGLIVTLVVGGLRRTLPKRYEAVEMHRMRAMDA